MAAFCQLCLLINENTIQYKCAPSHCELQECWELLDYDITLIKVRSDEDRLPVGQSHRRQHSLCHPIRAKQTCVGSWSRNPLYIRPSRIRFRVTISDIRHDRPTHLCLSDSRRSVWQTNKQIQRRRQTRREGGTLTSGDNPATFA